MNLAAWLLGYAGGKRLTLPNAQGEQFLISDLFLQSAKTYFERSTDRVLAKTSDVMNLLRSPEIYQQAKMEVWPAELDEWQDLVGTSAALLDRYYG